MSSILVIDDEDLFRESTAQALRRRGFDTLEAGSGRDGAELARRHLPDLVLCDVNMEQMNGYQMLETLRREPATASIPFILMTGMGDTEAMRKGMEMGADDYLPKPFTAPQLLGAIDARLKKRDILRQSAEKKLADLRANLTLSLPHEMVTPLNGIFGLAQLLAAEAQSLGPQEVAEFGRDILLCAERLQRTVQNFLLYGQLEIQAADPEARAALREQRTDQYGGLIENRARRAAAAADRAADLQLDLADGSVAMAPDLFTRLVDELVGNAFKFSQPGQPVRVVTVSDNATFKLAVEDRGPGMTPEQIANVSAYTQFDRRRKEQQGAGLGLAIVQRLSQLHGGELRIQSEPGTGTTVQVSLPGA
jgi:two-component system sensor histidine kinase/response regulator